MTGLTAVRVLRAIFTLALLYQIFHHSHWSVFLFCVLTAISLEAAAWFIHRFVEAQRRALELLARRKGL